MSPAPSPTSRAHAAACSVADTLEVLGDRWTMHVLHEVLIGVRRFDALQQRLGVSTSVLTRRLSALEDHGIVERRPYRCPGQRTRHEYHLTAVGRALRPVLVAMMDFGDRHLADRDEQRLVLRHPDCGHAVHAEVRCEAGHPIGDDQPLVPDQPATGR